MPNASNALLEVEFSESLVPMMLLTDSGNRTKFNSGHEYISAVPLFEPTILPNGIRSGGDVTPAAVNDQITVEESESNLNGVIHIEPGATLTVARPASAKKKISSVTLTAGLAYAMVAGADGDDFSEVRGAAGGPPYIPVGSNEVAQVRLSSDVAALITTAQIKSVPGTHTELAGFPTYELDSYLGTVTFSAALPAIHTGDVTKRTYAELYTAEFAKIRAADAYTPPRKTYSSSSTSTYDGPIVTAQEALGSGSFTVQLEDGIVDLAMKVIGTKRWIRFYPFRTRTTRFQIVQAILGGQDTYPSGGPMVGTFTLTSEREVISVGG